MWKDAIVSDCVFLCSLGFSMTTLPATKERIYPILAFKLAFRSHICRSKPGGNRLARYPFRNLTITFCLTNPRAPRHSGRSNARHVRDQEDVCALLTRPSPELR